MSNELKLRAWDKYLRRFVHIGFHVIGEVTMFNAIEQYCGENPVEGYSVLRRMCDIELHRWTGLKDINGTGIYENDRLRFYPGPYGHRISGIWDGTVIIEDGISTVSIHDARQVVNPVGWKKTHDWISSRSWACQVGYGEWGNWYVPRTPLTLIQYGFGHTVEDYEKRYKPLCEKYGYEHRYINAELIGYSL